MEAVPGKPGYLATSGIRAGRGDISPGGKRKGRRNGCDLALPGNHLLVA